MNGLTLRNVSIDGGPLCDVAVAGGRITAIGPGLPRDTLEIEGHGGALIPGLHDHHIHLLATAARDASIDLADVTDEVELTDRVRRKSSRAPAGTWLRATGCPAALAATLEKAVLDQAAPAHPLRLGDRTGALWILNSAALARLGDDLPEGFERGPDGQLTGRVWRQDHWLRGRIQAGPPPLAPLGRMLASFGITAVTDASATTDAGAATLLADAHRTTVLPQRLTLMSAGPLVAAEDGAFAVGPVKVLLDERALPDFDDLIDTMRRARRQDRRIAVHCVTATELALNLAAFGAVGALDGDRIEHGAVIPSEAIEALAELGLTVVTQPVFLAEQGDRYLREVAKEDLGDLYRVASLARAGVRVLASSDGPYGALDPWRGMAAAVTRRSASGQVLGADDRLSPRDALNLYRDQARQPGARLSVGDIADLCLLAEPLGENLPTCADGHVAATIIGGVVVHGQALT